MTANAPQNPTHADPSEHARRMEALGRLAGGIAHDFNNLLTSIRGLGSLALDELAPDHPIRPDLEEILKAAQRATELTGELLAFSGRQRMEPGALDLNALVDDTARRIRARHPSIKLRVTAEPVPPVAADPAKLAIALENLLSSAALAGDAAGAVSVETTLGRLDANQVPGLSDGRYAAVRVSDDNPLTPAQLDVIFEPFAAPRSATKGTGLMLAVAYGIVRRAGGLLVAAGNHDGVTLTAYLPLAPLDDARPA